MPGFIIKHFHWLKLMWDGIIILLIIYTAIAMPFLMCFQIQSKYMNYFDIIIDVFFIIDIVLNFFTTYVDKKGEIVTSPKKIRMYYIKGWFAVDCIAAIPYLIYFTIISMMVRIYLCIHLAISSICQFVRLSVRPLVLLYSCTRLLAYSCTRLLLYSPTPVLAHSCTRLLLYSPTPVLVYSSTRLLVYSPTRLLAYSCTRLLVYSCTRLLLYSPTPVFAYSCIRLLLYSPTPVLVYSPTRLFAYSCTRLLVYSSTRLLVYL